MLIDDKGRIFGKINVIDALVLLFIFCIIPMFYFGYKIVTEKRRLQEKVSYSIIRSCPNCNSRSITIRQKIGEPLPEFVETICSNCKNKVRVFTWPDYEQEYYKRLLEKDLHLEKEMKK